MPTASRQMLYSARYEYARSSWLNQLQRLIWHAHINISTFVLPTRYTPQPVRRSTNGCAHLSYTAAWPVRPVIIKVVRLRGAVLSTRRG